MPALNVYDLKLLAAKREREDMLLARVPFVPPPSGAYNLENINGLRVMAVSVGALAEIQMAGNFIVVQTRTTGSLNQEYTVVSQSHLASAAASARLRHEQIGRAHRRIFEQLRQVDAEKVQGRNEAPIIEENFDYPQDRMFDTRKVHRLRLRKRA